MNGKIPRKLLNVLKRDFLQQELDLLMQERSRVKDRASCVQTLEDTGSQEHSADASAVLKCIMQAHDKEGGKKTFALSFPCSFTAVILCWSAF
jgi:hypothetical protein